MVVGSSTCSILFQGAQEEREALLLKQEELTSQLTELRQTAELQGQEAVRLADRVRLLESTVDATHAERKQLDQELALAKEESSSRSIEISRLTTLLDNAKAKIEELEQAREVGDKTELDEMLDNARKEKDSLESQVATLQEQLSRSQCEVARLRDQLSHIQVLILLTSLSLMPHSIGTASFHLLQAVLLPAVFLNSFIPVPFFPCSPLYAIHIRLSWSFSGSLSDHASLIFLDFIAALFESSLMQSVVLFEVVTLVCLWKGELNE
jgi:Chromosome segregation ATPases